MKIIFYIGGALLILTLISGCALFRNLIFKKEETQKEIKSMPDFEYLQEGIEVTEKESSIGIIGNHRVPPRGDGLLAKEQILLTEGTFIMGRRISTSDPGTDVLSLDLTHKKLVSAGNTIKEYRDDSLEKVQSFQNPAIDFVRAFGLIREPWYFLIVKPENSAYNRDRRLWLLNYDQFQVHPLSEDPYYSSRPPLVLSPLGLEGVLLVYYTGSLSFAHGGDVSRPEYSVIRLFNEENPQGLDLVKFHFNAGTVYDAKIEEGVLVLYSNPSLPSQALEHDLPIREWYLRGDFHLE